MPEDAQVIALPPPYTLVRSDDADALEAAVRLAPEAGAGTLVLHEAPGRLAIAVVLEPEEPLATSQLAFLLGMAALADALAAHCPPERPLRIVWPDEIRYDGARLGGGRFAVAPGTGPQDVPDWLAFAAELIADRDHLPAPGEHPGSTSLKEEAFDPAEDIVATFASYMMLYFDRWTHEGIDAVTNRYLMRIDPPLLRGVRRIEGDRLVEITPSGNRRHPPLIEALGTTGWRDASGPRL
jgi:hypothetical protein